MEDTNTIVAPFVLKTYHMVDDLSTNLLVRWGRANNSFIVVDVSDFSQRLLPVYFKHSNFSSFVRQLNTYGFKKVDPDKWEFANKSFLRGEIQLLKNIVRRKYNSSNTTCFMQPKQQEEQYLVDVREISGEIARLKQEQKTMEEELQGMNKRLQTTEKRPQQMMRFLLEAVEEPEILTSMMVERVKKRRCRPESFSDWSNEVIVLQERECTVEAAGHSSFPFSLLGG